MGTLANSKTVFILGEGVLQSVGLWRPEEVGLLVVTYRAFRSSDQDAVRGLVLSGLGEHFANLDARRNPDLDDIGAFYVAAGSCFLVAEKDDRIVACGALVSEREGVGRLARVSVARDCRRQGVAFELSSRLIREAAARGYQRLVVETNDDWAGAIGLYLKLGFVVDFHQGGEVHLVREVV